MTAQTTMTAKTSLSQAQEKYYPFLIEVRKRLLFVVAFFFIAASVGFLQYQRIVNLILNIFQLDGVNIVFTSPFQFMELAISSAFAVGLIAVFPLIVFQILSFIRPALKPNEFKMVLLVIPLSIILFLFGFSTGALMMRYVVELFYEKSQELQIGNFLDISKLLSQIIVTSSLMGIAFEFPIVMTLLIKLKVLKIKDVEKQRMVAWGSSVFFAALLPPTDVFSLIMLTAPLIVLFELTLILNKYVFKSRKRKGV